MKIQRKKKFKNLTYNIHILETKTNEFKERRAKKEKERK